MQRSFPASLRRLARSCWSGSLLFLLLATCLAPPAQAQTPADDPGPSDPEGTDLEPSEVEPEDGTEPVDDPEATGLEPDQPGSDRDEADPVRLIELVRLECDLPRCADPLEYQRLLSLSGLAAGKTFSSEQTRAAEFFLMETGFFGEVQVEVTDLADTAGGTIDQDTGESVSWERFGAGIEVTITATGRPRIRNVEISAVGLLNREVERRMFMRSGSAWEADRRERQIDVIRDIYLRQGYHEVRVTIDPIEVEPYLVDLEVIVNASRLLDVQGFYLLGNSFLSYEDVRSEVIGAFGFFRTFSEESFQSGLDDLLDLYREAGFIRAQIALSHAEPDLTRDAVDLFVEVREGSRWSFEFDGNDAISDTDLLEALPFFQTGFIDEGEVAASEQELKALYQTAGYYFASVESSIEHFDDETSNVVYRIREGGQVIIREISFEGNTAFTDQELTTLISTAEYGGLDSASFLQPAQVEGDIRRIEDHYRENGYLRAYVPRWTLVTEADASAFYITIFIDEGPVTLVGTVSVEGNVSVSSEALLSDLRLETGAPFSRARLRSAQAKMVTTLQGRGFAPRPPVTTCRNEAGDGVDCDVIAIPASCFVYGDDVCSSRMTAAGYVEECPRIESSMACEPSDAVPEGVINVNFAVDEGELITVGEVFIVGNYDTNGGVIRREFGIRPGDPLDPTLMLQRQSNLRSLGLFDSVSVTTIGVSQSAQYRRNQAAIVISVEESRTLTLDYNMALQSQNTSDNRVRLVFGQSLVFNDKNFTGAGLQLSLGGSFEFDIIGNANLSEQEFIASAVARVANPRFYWFDSTDDPWETALSLGGFYDLVAVPLQVRELILTANTQQEFEDVEGLFINVELETTLSNTRRVPEQADFQTTIILEVSPSLTLDRRDHPINPTSGYRLEIDLDLADGPESVLGIDAARFTRLQLSGSQFVPLGRGFVFGSYLRFGAAVGGPISGLIGLFSTDDEPDEGTGSVEDRIVLPDTSRFRLGGVSGLRGFADNSLGPTSPLGIPTDGDAVMNGTLELRFPIVPSIFLEGAVFLEAGQLHADLTDFTLNEFRYSTGIGLRFIPLNLVPIVFDYGIALDRRPGEALGQLNFNIGFSF